MTFGRREGTKLKRSYDVDVIAVAAAYEAFASRGWGFHEAPHRSHTFND
jgi:hypothetical protein